MRNVITTNSSPDVDADYADQVAAILDRQRHSCERESTIVNEDGETTLSVTLHTYESPDTGRTMWAVDYYDPASRELEETADEAEANARYEELVRAAAANFDYDRHGYQTRYTTTDVDGVPGPLPYLPDVETEDVAGLIDAPGSPALYLTLEGDDGDEPVVKVGQEHEVPFGQRLLTRSETLAELSLSDEQGRITSEAAVASDQHGMLAFIAHRATEQVRAAADVLFTVPTA
ncbi:hypothetical protein AB0D90_14690 [Streptomyces althioticus]|uniref:hypothetical protein n=1 Tax=Streptomyces althioticus TaxID=83380 RepID=UPI0033C2A861